jgi:phage protein D
VNDSSGALQPRPRAGAFLWAGHDVVDAAVAVSPAIDAHTPPFGAFLFTSAAAISSCTLRWLRTARSRTYAAATDP